MRAIFAVVPALALASLALASCGGGEDGEGRRTARGDDYIDPPPLWSDYVVGYGETINLNEGVAIEFLALEEESRCPVNVQCATAGNARIRVRALTPRGATELQLNTNPSLPNAALFDYYGVTLRNLSPYPVMDTQTGTADIPLHTYEATVFVIKAAEPP